MKTHVYYLRGLIALALGFGFAGGVAAAELGDSAEVHFRQGRSALELDFGGNGLRLDSMKREMERNGALRVAGIRVTGGASPEGSVEINRRLSERRAEVIFNYFGMSDSIASFDYIGRDWQGLARLVEADESTPSRAEVLSLLEEINSSLAAGKADDAANLQRLKAVGGGRAYAYMYSRMFPSLRFSRLSVDYEPQIRTMKVGAGLPSLTLTPVVTAPQLELTQQETDSRRPFYMSLKTNMLYDVLGVPNVGAEFYLGRNWTVTGSWAYAWWNKDRTHHYWRYYGGEIGVRRWFGSASKRKPLTGHHVGLTGGVFTYDFELGGRGYMGGKPGHSLWDRCMVTGGVEYGYSLPVARRLNIDFTIGLGYVGGKVVEYTPEDGQYVWQKTKRVNWVGPTRAEISLVWLIGHDNVNRQKGGLR